MRLYLTSHNLGPYTDELLNLVGNGRSALFIENARDYYPMKDAQMICKKN